MTIDERYRAWLEAEREAVEAELRIAQLGQAAADPAAAALCQRAKELRDKADLMFKEIYRARQDGSPS